MTLSKTLPLTKGKSGSFWLLLSGLVLSSAGTSMVWPFLMTYAKTQLNLPMVIVASLMTINSITGFLGSIIAGPQLDLRGRKWIMVVGLLGTALAYLGYIGANTYLHFAIIMGLTGFFGPLYRVGSAAMITDWFDAEHRPQAFAYYRTAGNLGFALGPAIGGRLLMVSYNYGMIAAFITLGIFGLITIFLIPESLPKEGRSSSQTIRAQFKDYVDSFRDKRFSQILTAYTLQEIAARVVWVLLATYMSITLGFPKSYYGWIAMTNGLMIVFLQLLVTQQTRKYPEIKVLPVGAAVYAVALLVYGLVQTIYGFVLAMAIMTVGEMINAPTATTYVSNIAPATKRGQYLSVFNLTWYFALALGPVGGGYLADKISPQAPFFGGSLMALLSVFVFIYIGFAWRRESGKTQPPSSAEASAASDGPVKL
ncbi:MAG: MFS transporter [Anaerolineaceae bacterium]|nr:MFS transporter [Anaerolineaceae bacterium]